MEKGEREVYMHLPTEQKQAAPTLASHREKDSRKDGIRGKTRLPSRMFPLRKRGEEGGEGTISSRREKKKKEQYFLKSRARGTGFFGIGGHALIPSRPKEEGGGGRGMGKERGVCMPTTEKKKPLQIRPLSVRGKTAPIT